MKEKREKNRNKKSLTCEINIFLCGGDLDGIPLWEAEAKSDVRSSDSFSCLWESMFQGQPVIRQTISITSLADCAVSCWCCRHHA